MFRPFAILVLLLTFASEALAVDTVTFENDGVEMQIRGRVVVEAQDGGLLVMDRAGKLWTVTAKAKKSHTTDELPFKPFTQDEIGREILKELPKRFQVHKTAHYVIIYDTSRGYARWCGTLLERLYGTFSNFWKKKKFDLKEPEMPMVAVVFADKATFHRYMEADIGRTSSIVGYYNLINNRVAMYDLTGVQNHRSRGHASDRLQLWAADPAGRCAILAKRRYRDVLRNAQPRKLWRLARHRQGEPFATVEVPKVRPGARTGLLA